MPTDYKRCVFRARNPEWSTRLGQMISTRRIMSFPAICDCTEIGKLSDDEKHGCDIIQLSFVITMPRPRRYAVLIERREHGLTKGRSILQSTSPVWVPHNLSRACPTDLGDILAYYNDEIVSPEAPTFTFLGLVQNQRGGAIYYAYIFEASYTHDVELRLRHKGEDEFLGFRPAGIVDELRENKMDVRVAEVIFGQSLAHFGYGDSVFIPATGAEDLFSKNVA